MLNTSLDMDATAMNPDAWGTLGWSGFNAAVALASFLVVDAVGASEIDTMEAVAASVLVGVGAEVAKGVFL